MTWNGRDLALLKRIVAMLFLLAFLAERAAMAPRRTRRNVLEILYQAEILARRVVAGATLDFVAAPLQTDRPDPVFLPSGSHPADAVDLALRMRAFALVLAHLIVLTEQLARNGEVATSFTRLSKPLQLAFDQLSWALLAAIRAPPGAPAPSPLRGGWPG